MDKDANYTTDTMIGVSFLLTGARLCTVRVYPRKVSITVKYQRTGGIKAREYPLDSRDRQYLISLRTECDQISATKFKALKDRHLAHERSEVLYGKAVYRYISSIPRSDSLF